MIERVDLEHSQELDAFVAAHPHCHFMQTSLWGKVKRDWQWCGFLCRAQDGTIRGSIALLQHRYHFLRTSLLYAPCGPIFDDGDKETFGELIAAAKEYGREVHACTLRIDPRIVETDTNFLQLSYETGFVQNTAIDYSLFQPRMNYILPLEGLNADTLLAQYHAGTRRNTRIAQRNGVIIRQGCTADLPAFCRMMAQTAKKDGFHPKSKAFFATLLKELGEHGRLYLAQKDGAVIAGALIAQYGNATWLLYCCSDCDSLSDRPNELLQYQMQADALAAGCSVYDFRGVEGYPTEDNPKLGLHRYKQGFGGKFIAYVGQLDLCLRPRTTRLLLLLETLL